jgi:hypothetical protein
MNRQVQVLFAGIAALATVISAARSDDPVATDNDDKAAQAEEAKARGKFMIDALAEYKLEAQQAGQLQLAKLVPEPALRWTNTVSGTKDGIVGVWTRGGRPDAVAQFAGYSSMIFIRFIKTQKRSGTCCGC